MVPYGERIEICMSEEKQRRDDAVAGKEAWVAVFCWTGICPLRLLIGLVLGALLGGIRLAIDSFFPTDYDYEWGLVTILSALVLTIALVTFLPLWRGMEKVNIRGFANTVSATGKLLVPSILFQLFVTLRGEPIEKLP